MDISNVFDDLADEQDRLETLLEVLDEADWLSPSAAPGWSVVDVVLHLAQIDEAVVASTAGSELREDWAAGRALDEIVDAWVQAERKPPAVVFGRWCRASRAALAALRQADPARSFPWATSPLKSATLATTRLAEHWAHALDVAVPLGIPLPDTDRLRHVAWLAHRSLPYAFTIEGQQPQELFCELTSPSGFTWHFGSPDAPSSVTGPVGDFCRVGARRLAPEQSALVPRGPHGVAALRVLRTYAA